MDWLAEISPTQILFLTLLALLTACVILRVEVPMLRGMDPNWSARIGPYASLLHFHASCGLLALLSGPVQFLSVLRRHAPRLHRVLGIIYILSIVAAGLSALWIAYHYMNPADGLAAMAQAVIWIFTTAAALHAIKQREVQQHRLWIARSYSLTFTFVLSRFVTEILHWHVNPDSGGNAAFIWMLSLGVLIVSEVCISIGDSNGQMSEN